MSMDEKLKQVVARHEELGHAMSSQDTPNADDFARMSKEYASLTSVVTAIGELDKARDEFMGLVEIVDDPDSDREMRDMAEAEINEMKKNIPELEQKIKLKPKKVISKNEINKMLRHAISNKKQELLTLKKESKL